MIISVVAQAAPTSPSQIIAEYIIGGGGLALAVALFRAGSILGAIKQMLGEHERRIDRVERRVFNSDRTRRRGEQRDE